MNQLPFSRKEFEIWDLLSLKKRLDAHIETLPHHLKLTFLDEIEFNRIVEIKTLIERHKIHVKQVYTEIVWDLIFKNKEKVKFLKKYVRKKREELSKPQEAKDETKSQLVKQAWEIPEKWSALLYLIELAIKKERLPEDFYGKLRKTEIMEIGKNRGYKTGQYFYMTVKEYSLDSPAVIANSFGKNWKEKIISLSENSAEITSFLKEKYD